MLVAEGGGSVRPVSPPPPPPPPPTHHVVKSGETVHSVAQHYHVAPQTLASANHIPVDATLHAGQTLVLPQPEYHTAVGAGGPGGGGPAEQTPQQKTDAAAKAYQQAIKHRDQAVSNAPANMWIRGSIWKSESQKVSAARSAFDKAVKTEIADHVSKAQEKAEKQYEAVPPQVRHGLQMTPPHVDAAAIAQKTERSIEARYADDPRLATEVKTAFGEYQAQQKTEQLEQKASDLVPYYGPGVSAADKLKGIHLEGQPKAVVKLVLNDPRVKAWIKQAAADIGKPYDGVDKGDLSMSLQQAHDSLKQLVDSTSGMNPALVAALVEKSMPTITKMGQLDHRYGALTFEDLSQVVDAMQGAPGAARATSDIAAAIKPNFGDGFGYTGPGVNGAIVKTIADGNSATLAIELAHQLKADGNPQADAVVTSVVQGAQQLQDQTAKDLKDYAGKTEELSWLIKNEGGVMTSAQLKKAIAQYKANQIKKDPDWEKNIQKAQDKVVADGKALMSTIAALQNLPPNLQDKNTAKALGVLQDKVGNSDTTRDAISFAIDQDPTLMKGSEGKALVDFYSGMTAAGKGRVFFGKLLNNYVSQTLLSQVQNVDPNHPESISKANTALEELKTQWKAGHWGKALGIKDGDLDKVIADVKNTFPHKGDTVTSVAGRLEKLDAQLNKTEGFAQNTAAGGIFRAFGFATNAAWFAGSVSSSGKPVEATIGGLAAAVGMSQSATDFAASIKLLDEDGSLAQWGRGASAAGKLASKFVGWAVVGLSADAAVRSFASGDVPAGILNTTAAGGAAVAILFADTAWGGPVGLAIGAASVLGLSIYNHVKDSNKHQNERTVQFLENAGFSHDAAKALSDESGNGYSPVPLLVEYAKDKGYNMSDPAQRQKVVGWINGMSSKELDHVRDWMHHTLDDFDGDASKLGKDTTPVWPTKFIVAGGYPSRVYVTPHTVGALDGMMKNYGVTPLPVA